nr:hypothetical protein [Lentzea indica]
MRCAAPRSCKRASYTATPDFSRLAAYIAMSACRNNSWPSPESEGHSATPTLPAISSSRPSSVTGMANAERILSATMRAFSAEPTPGSSTANSSPPRRATRSVSRTAHERRLATWRSSRSPEWCPSESLTSLNLSRSTISNASGSSFLRAFVTASSIRRASSDRLARPVNASWWASCSFLAAWRRILRR